jgi:hypothetical protein
MSFGGTRTYHRLACAIEDAGWQIFDCIFWCYGVGFPKSHNISKAIDKKFGKKIENKSEFTDFSKQTDTTKHIQRYKKCKKCGKLLFGQDPCQCEWRKYKGQTELAKQWEGWGTALKPAIEPIVCARKPNEGSYAQNALKWGVSGLNIDGARIGTEDKMKETKYPAGRAMCPGGGKRNTPEVKIIPHSQGRFPANIILEQSYIPLLTLKGNCDRMVEKVIRQYYENYEVPSMWQRVPNLSEQDEEWSEKVLQQEMLSQSPEKLSPTNVGKETQQGNITKNEKQEIQEGKGKPNIQREMENKGLLDDKSKRTNKRGKGDSNSNVSKESSWNNGTQDNNGNGIRQTFKEKGDSSSQERDKRRQQNKEFGNNKQHKSHSTSSQVSGGEQKIEVLIGDVPKAWLRYFRPTGYSIVNPESSAKILDEQSGETTRGHWANTKVTGYGATTNYQGVGRKAQDKGGASRFFYVAKASRSERNLGCEGLEEKKPHTVYAGDEWSLEHLGNTPANYREPIKNNHPTVKPLKLMEYLCILTKTPTGGIVFDPFAGSGTTLMAAKKTNRDFIGIEKEKEYVEIAKARIKATPKPLL